MPLTRADRLDAVKALALKLDASPYGERRGMVECFAAGLAVSAQTVYRWLRQVGWESGRKPRADKGTTSQPLDVLASIAAMKKSAVRQNGKATLNTTTAVGIAINTGMEVKVGTPRVNALMRQFGLDVRSQSRAASHVHMRSLHANHVHQVDASLCLLYYFKGEQRVIREDQLYKNKLESLARVKFKVYRWVLVDHASGVIVPWYTESAGEDTHSLAEFLLYAWGRCEPRPFHGVPKIIVWDKGAANKSHAVKSLLKALEVQEISHAVGNSRAKGSVEGAQNIVETQFESRLRFEPVDNVAELNEAAAAWAHAYCANAIAGQDTRIHRGPLHLSRYALWRPTEGELRVLPDAELCRALLAGREETRKVHGDLQIQFKHPASDVALRYDLRGLEGISVHDTVQVQPLLYGDCRVLVSIARYDGQAREWTLEPIRDYDRNGFRVGGAVFGETFRANPQTAIETAGKMLDRVAFGNRPEEEIARAKEKNETPFGGLIDAVSHLKRIEQPPFLPRRGTEIAVPDRVEITVAPLTRIAACRALVAILGRPLTTPENQKVGVWYPEGVPEADLPNIALALRTGTTPFRHLGEREASA